ncbi:MAG TPA: 3-oxoacyl-ACP synthase III family protein [Cyclobacteriaceae bacterium]
MLRTVIIGTGSYIPETRICNSDFLVNTFFQKSGQKVSKDTDYVIEKFREITGIEERRYATIDQSASDLGYLAAVEAINSAKIDKETLDYIIVAHNFGDVDHKSNRSSLVPSLASRIKSLLQIVNPDCVAYDLPFGCPGWVEALIQANYFLKSGDVKRCLVIGTETLSRVIDPHDRDSMIYSDGSGAVVVEAQETTQRGIIAHKTQTHAYHYSELLNMDHSYGERSENEHDLYIKMNGRRVYEFALNQVPLAIKAALDKAEMPISKVKKILIHQANEKMDNAILERLFQLFGVREIPENIMPMTIGWLGNSSVATIPTMLDLILKGKLTHHEIVEGDNVIIASVGAGMNINAVIYQF